MKLHDILASLREVGQKAPPATVSPRLHVSSRLASRLASLVSACIPDYLCHLGFDSSRLRLISASTHLGFDSSRLRLISASTHLGLTSQLASRLSSRIASCFASRLRISHRVSHRISACLSRRASRRSRVASRLSRLASLGFASGQWTRVSANCQLVTGLHRVLFIIVIRRVRPLDSGLCELITSGVAVQSRKYSLILQPHFIKTQGPWSVSRRHVSSCISRLRVSHRVSHHISAFHLSACISACLSRRASRVASRLASHLGFHLSACISACLSRRASRVASRLSRLASRLTFLTFASHPHLRFSDSLRANGPGSLRTVNSSPDYTESFSSSSR